MSDTPPATFRRICHLHTHELPRTTSLKQLKLRTAVDTCSRIEVTDWNSNGDLREMDALRALPRRKLREELLRWVDEEHVNT